MIPNEEINRLIEISKIGDDLKNFKEQGGCAVLQKHILTPLEKGAFDAFKNVPAEDTNRVMETQMMWKIIDMIRKTIDIKINEGLMAKNQLNNPKGDYDI